MSIVYQPPPRFSGTSAATGTTFSSFSRPHNDSVGRPPLLSIPQIQPTTISTASSSQSPTSSVSEYSPKLNKPLTPTREKRRKLRSTRAVSPVPASLSSNPSGLLPNSHHPSRKPRAQYQSESLSDDTDHKPLLPLRRLDLKSSKPPLPPSIPPNIMIAPSQCSYANTPIVEPSYTTPRDTPKDTYTCIRTPSNPFSASISTQPPTYFTKTVPRSHRTQRSSLSSTLDYPTSFLEINKSEEQDKWWHWAKICKVTGDGNKSSYLTPLPCQDLKRNFDDYNNDTNQQDTDFRIQTRPLSESAIEQQKFYYSGS
ncbi:hypothetical protein KEM48_013308 [Puccinia striiformis f. sp. tritici PST-130]|nr:hypothetical protein KEM48_013308 [Puccinia striiformis f. sp. tritici PST-130]POW00285.1 hypothetical protein PSTT_13245 [Puccinia striiformis]